MSDNNQVTIAYGPAESSYGEDVSGNPTLQEIPFSSEDMKKDTTTARSKNIRPDGRANKLRRQGYQANGGFSADFVYGAFDDFLMYALRAAAWTALQTLTATTISVESIATSSSSYAKIKDSANGLGIYVVNQWIRIQGLTGQAADNEFHKVVSVSAGELEVSGDFVDMAAGPSVTVLMGQQITDATTLNSFPLERNHGSLSNVFDYYTGVFVTKLGLSINKESDIEIRVDLAAKDEFDGGGATVGDGSNTAASTNPSMNSTDNVLAITADGAVHDVESFSFEIDPKLTGRTFVGKQGIQSVRKGGFAGNGSYKILFTSQSLMNKYRNFQSMPIVLIMTDDDGNSYVIDTPSVKPSSASNNASSGEDSDTMLEMSFEAEPDDDESVVIRIAKFDKP